MSTLLAAAFNLNVDAAGSAQQAQPVLGMMNGGDDKTYLTLSFRRRLQASGFTYIVETSSDLTTWSSTGGDVTEIGTTPTGDGVTEVCTCRITPAVSDTSKKFVRVRPMLNQ